VDAQCLFPSSTHPGWPVRTTPAKFLHLFTSSFTTLHVHDTFTTSDTSHPFNGQTLNQHITFPPNNLPTDTMYYPASAGSTVSFAAPMMPGTRAYYPTAAPMSAVLPGQHYYPTMHAAPMAYPATAAPMMYQQPAMYPGGYYGHQPTVILESPRSRRHRSRSRTRGFLGYL